MGASIQDIAAYINNPVAFVATDALEILEGHAQQRGIRETLGVRVETPNGHRIGFLEADVPVGFSATLTDPSVLPALIANTHFIEFDGDVTKGEIVKIGATTFEFEEKEEDVAEGHVFVDIGDGKAATAAENLLDAYNDSPDVATAEAVDSTTLSFSNPLVAFGLATDGANVVHSALVKMRDGAASVSLAVPAGAPVEAGDEFELTFGPVSLPDGRTLSAATTGVEVT